MVSLERYSCMCEKNDGLALLKSKANAQQFVKCKKGLCGFFCRADQLADYLEVIESKVLVAHKKAPPMCDDGLTATLAVSQSAANPGRPYFRCGQRQKCGFFEWGDREISRKVEKKIYADQSTQTDPVHFKDPGHEEPPKKKKPNSYRIPKKRVIEDDE